MRIPTGLRPRAGLRLRLILAFGLLSLLVAAITAVALWGLSTLRASAYQAASDNQISRLASEVAIRALLCRRYEKDFFLNAGDLNRQDTPLQQWQQASIDLRSAIQAYQDAAVSATERQQGQAWRDAWGTYVHDFGGIEIAINGGQIKTPEDALKAFEPAQENIQTLTDQAVQVAQQTSTSARQTSTALDTTSVTTIWQVAGIALIVLIASLVWSLLFPFWLVRPIRVLHATAARLAGGDLTARVALRRSDELGMLAESFDHMAEQIQHSTAALSEHYRAAEDARQSAEAAHDQIAEQLAMIEAQQAIIREMSVPILPLSAMTLVLPLIGALDSARLQMIQQQALHAIEQARARYLLLDITGVPVVDQQVAGGLTQVVHAAQLLGCVVVLVGIRPEVAQAIVSSNLDLQQVVTLSTLQSGIAYTMQGARSRPIDRPTPLVPLNGSPHA